MSAYGEQELLHEHEILALEYDTLQQQKDALLAEREKLVEQVEALSADGKGELEDALPSGGAMQRSSGLQTSAESEGGAGGGAVDQEAELERVRVEYEEEMMRLTEDNRRMFDDNSRLVADNKKMFADCQRFVREIQQLKSEHGNDQPSPADSLRPRNEAAAAAAAEPAEADERLQELAQQKADLEQDMHEQHARIAAILSQRPELSDSRAPSASEGTFKPLIIEIEDLVYKERDLAARISALEAENDALSSEKNGLLDERDALAGRVEELQAEDSRSGRGELSRPASVAQRQGSVRSVTYGEIDDAASDLGPESTRTSSRGSVGRRNTLKSAAPLAGDGVLVDGLEIENVSGPPGLSAEEERELRGSLKQAEGRVEQMGMENDRLREEVRSLMAPGRETLDGDERLQQAVGKIERLEEDNAKLREEVGSLLGELDQVVADNQLLIQDNQQLIDQNTELQQMANTRPPVAGADGEAELDADGKLTQDEGGSVDYEQLFADNMKLASDNRQLLDDNNRLFADNKKIITDLSKLQEHGDTLFQDNCKLAQDLEDAVQQQQVRHPLQTFSCALSDLPQLLLDMWQTAVGSDYCGQAAEAPRVSDKCMWVAGSPGRIGAPAAGAAAVKGGSRARGRACE